MSLTGTTSRRGTAAHHSRKRLPTPYCAGTQPLHPHGSILPKAQGGEPRAQLGKTTRAGVVRAKHRFGTTQRTMAATESRKLAVAASRGELFEDADERARGEEPDDETGDHNQDHESQRACDV
jgi:hypothetical protein